MRVERGTSDAKRGRGGATIHGLIHSLRPVSLSLSYRFNVLSQNLCFRSGVCSINAALQRQHFFSSRADKVDRRIYFFLGVRHRTLCARTVGIDRTRVESVRARNAPLARTESTDFCVPSAIVRVNAPACNSPRENARVRAFPWPRCY